MGLLTRGQPDRLGCFQGCMVRIRGWCQLVSGEGSIGLGYGSARGAVPGRDSRFEGHLQPRWRFCFLAYSSAATNWQPWRPRPTQPCPDTLLNHIGQHRGSIAMPSCTSIHILHTHQHTYPVHTPAHTPCSRTCTHTLCMHPHTHSAHAPAHTQCARTHLHTWPCPSRRPG